MEISNIEEQNPNDMPQKTSDVKAGGQENQVKDLYFGTAEKTFRESPIDPNSMYNPWNPDDLYQKAGDYSIYEEMELDDQVSVCQELKLDMIIGSGYEFKCEDDEHEEIQWDLERAFEEDLDRSFDEILEEILSAYSFGFSISEKIFKTRADGSLTLKDIRTRHPNTFTIETDPKGVIKTIKQSAMGGDIVLNQKSLIHFKNKPRFGNPYGRSDLRKAYNAWFVKRHVTRFYSIFLEKGAAPFPAASYDQMKTEKADVEAIFTALKKIQQSSAIVHPDVIDVEWLSSQNSGEAYIKGLNLFNMYIGRSLLIPDLMGFQGSATGGGSYTLGKEQMAIFVRHINRRRGAIERIINKELVWPLVVYNFGFVPFYPKFKLKSISTTDALEFAKVFLQAINGKAYKPSEQEINHFRGLIEFPEGEVEFVETPSQDPSSNNGGGNPLLDGLPGMGGQNQPNDNTPPELPSNNPSDSGQAIDSMDDKNLPTEDEPSSFSYEDIPGNYSKKVDFKAIGTQLDANELEIVNKVLPIYRTAYEDLKAQIEKKRILERKKFEQIGTLKLKGTTKAAKLLNESLKSHYEVSQRTAERELIKTYAINMKKVDFSLPLNTSEFLLLLESENFGAIRDWDYSLLRLIETELRAAVRDGRPLSSVFDNLDSTVDDVTRQSLERFSRTKGTEIMNRARLDFFESTGSVQGYQYSAILDGRTSPICSGLHGKLFKKGTEPVPPMHFNCRSVLVPITIFEEFTPTTSIRGMSPDAFIEENIGKGFATK